LLQDSEETVSGSNIDCTKYGNTIRNENQHRIRDVTKTVEQVRY